MKVVGVGNLKGGVGKKRKNHNELYDQAKRNRTVITNNTLVQAKN